MGTLLQKTLMDSAMILVLAVGVVIAGTMPLAWADIGENSCMGDDACKGDNLSIGNNSCNGDGACGGNDLIIGNNACNGEDACNGNDNAVVGDSCNGEDACNGHDNFIDTSCNATNACDGNGNIIRNGSCNGENACSGNDNVIADATCNAANACDENGQAPEIGMARLEPFEDSGVRGALAFVDDGSVLQVVGIATGLDPTLDYATLIYDVQSDEKGPDPCTPQLPEGDPDDLRNTECVGSWVLTSSGMGMLEATNVFDEVGGGRVYMPLDKIGTTSIRQTSGATCPRPRPRQACGKVED